MLFPRETAASDYTRIRPVFLKARSVIEQVANIFEQWNIKNGQWKI